MYILLEVAFRVSYPPNYAVMKVFRQSSSDQLEAMFVLDIICLD